ncbi:hypothetical protein [Streptomyces roseirectus]|uniref:hypothetical protein n=1 Tax=Streptomyces roseirectus TaxID=2768066 RepID=UPI0031B598C5
MRGRRGDVLAWNALAHVLVTSSSRVPESNPSANSRSRTSSSARTPSPPDGLLPFRVGSAGRRARRVRREGAR